MTWQMKRYIKDVTYPGCLAAVAGVAFGLGAVSESWDAVVFQLTAPMCLIMIARLAIEPLKRYQDRWIANIKRATDDIRFKDGDNL